MKFLAFFGAFAGLAAASTFSYSDFSSTAGLTLIGDATQAGSVLRLVHADTGLTGNAWRTSAETMDAGTSFSTSFEFNVSTDTGNPTDGFSFILQNTADGNNASGGSGEGMGSVGLNPSVAVWFRGRAPSFIGVVLNGDDPLPSPPPGATNTTEGDFYNGNFFAWIDYNASNMQLDVYLNSTNTKPGSALLSNTVDIAGTLGGAQAYVGFGAGTGAAFGNNDILNWEFATTEAPEPATAGILGLGLMVLGVAGKRRRKS